MMPKKLKTLISVAGIFLTACGKGHVSGVAVLPLQSIEAPQSFMYYDMIVSPVFIVGTSVTATAGKKIVPVLTSGGGISEFSIEPPLPEGMAFDKSTGEISGTPNHGPRETQRYTIKARNSGGFASEVISFSVACKSSYQKGADCTILPLKVTAVTPLGAEMNILSRLSVEGENFQSGIKVTIGGLPCTPLQIEDSTHLSCIVPLFSELKAISNPIQVTGAGDLNEQVVIYPQTFQYYFPPISTLESGPTCLRALGTVWCWGMNSNNQLGNGTAVGSAIPVQVPGLTEISQVASSLNMSCAIKEGDRSVWCWGSSNRFLLGNGSPYGYGSGGSPPVQISGLSGVAQVTLGDLHSCAIKQMDGSIMCWGSNSFGNLGNGNRIDSNIPVQVSGLTGITQVAPGVTHTCAIKQADGSIWCWGSGAFGVLGNGVSISSNTPVQVNGILGITQLTHNAFHTCGVKSSDGTVWCWGFNQYGQIGNGTTTNSDTPVQVSGLLGMTQVSSGTFHSCSVQSSDGTVWCWGRNTEGELGNATVTDSLVPVQVTGLAGVSQIESMRQWTCALKSADRSVWCWGLNSEGQLGNGSVTPWSSIPVKMMGFR